MSLIPGTLPSGSCYGTPQQLLELFSQYLDVPAFAVSSKVLYSAVSPSPNTDYVWVDTTGGDTPLLNLYNDATGGYEPFPFAGGVSSNERLISDKTAITTLVNADLLLVSTLSGGSYSSLKKITFANAVSQIPAGTITPAQLSQPFTSATAVTPTGVTVVDFTGIPSWAKRVTVMFKGVSTSGADVYLIQIGSGSFTTTGYESATVYAGTSTSGMSGTAGFYMWNGTSAEIHSGTYTISLFSGTTYVGSGVHSYHAQTYTVTGAGVSPSLVGAIDRVRVTTNTGVDTFDLGSINIMYEG